jgi:hypothetical protein
VRRRARSRPRTDRARAVAGGRRSAVAPSLAGIEAPGARPVTWPSGAEIDGDVVAASLFEHARWRPDRWRRVDSIGTDVERRHEVAGSIDDAQHERLAVAPDAGPCIEAHERALRALRMARARRLARALIASTSRTP